MQRNSELIETIVLETDATPDQVREELLEASRRAARDYFGDELEFDATLDEETHDIQLFQVYEIVDDVENPSRQVSLEAAAPLYPGRELDPGDELHLRMFYTPASEERARAATQELSEVLAAPLYSDGFREELEQAINEVAVRHLTWEPPPEGSVGRLFYEGGGWLVGLSGGDAGMELTIEAADLSPLLIEPHIPRVVCEVTFLLEGEGESPRRKSVRTNKLTQDVGGGLELPASTKARSRVQETLEWMATQAKAAPMWESPGRFDEWPLYLLEAAQSAPRSDSLFNWCRDELRTWIIEDPVNVSDRDVRVEVDIQQMYLDADELSDRKSGWADLCAKTFKDDELQSAHEGSIPLGSLPATSFETPAPESALRDQLRRYVETWRRWIAHQLEEDLADGRETFSRHFWQFKYSRMELLDLVGAACDHGPPPEPPVPAPDDEMIDRGVERLEPPSEADRARIEAAFDGRNAEPFGVWRFGTYVLVLSDNLEHRPFSNSQIELHKDGCDATVTALLTDVWNPATKYCIDGDAYAFRRFTQWLRGVLRVADAEPTIEFQGDDSPVTLTAREWLLFDEPEDRDEFLIDWRYQRYVVIPGAPVESAASTFGFEPTYVKRLEEGVDRRIWREFLCEIVDPRFDYPRPPDAN